MKRTTASIVLLLTVALSGCTTSTPTTVEPGDGPAATESGEPMEGGSEPSTFDEPPTDEPTEEPEPDVAGFKDKYTYDDGAQVEVTKIQHGKVSAYDAEIDDSLKRGEDWVALTVRVKNGSSKRFDTDGNSGTLYYGPDGEEAQTPYLTENDPRRDMSGTLLPGKAKSGTILFLVPPKYQSDVVLEFSFDYEHESAVFSGSVK